MSRDPQEIVSTLLASGKGILAADETARRFDALGIPSTWQSGRTYREMLFTTPGAAKFISSVIMQEETIHQNGSPGSKPWPIGFSFGRALQDPALEAWRGLDENPMAGQQALYQRACCNCAACLGTYTDEMEITSSAAPGEPP